MTLANYVPPPTVHLCYNRLQPFIIIIMPKMKVTNYSEFYEKCCHQNNEKFCGEYGVESNNFIRTNIKNILVQKNSTEKKFFN